MSAVHDSRRFLCSLFILLHLHRHAVINIATKPTTGEL